MFHNDIEYKNIQPFILFSICWQESGIYFLVGNKDFGKVKLEAQLSPS